MSIATEFVHELFEGARHRLHHDASKPVPAARDWDTWHYADPQLPWENET